MEPDSRTIGYYVTTVSYCGSIGHHFARAVGECVPGCTIAGNCDPFTCTIEERRETSVCDGEFIEVSEACLFYYGVG